MLLSDGNWGNPLVWHRSAEQQRKRHRVFCASMADVFDAEAPAAERQRLWGLIDETPWLDWQVLTKRPEYILEMIPERWLDAPPSNVWYGASVGISDTTWRIDALREVPAVVRFLSVEPLLGPLPDLDLEGISWVIAGGESGPRARPMHIDWVRGIRDQVVAAGIPFFFKQWGQHDAHGVRQRSKSAAGRVLDDRTWDQFPVPGKPMPRIAKGVR